MTAPSIAAIVTCRDLGRTLDEALDSVERQTRPAAEILIVDDASEDLHTRQVLSRLRREGTRVVQAGGRGAAAARNLGARLTSADYLVWVDADDTIEPGYFAAAAARLDGDPDLDFVTCAMQAFGAASYRWTPVDPTFVEAIATGAVPHASTMVRRRLWTGVGGFDEELATFELLDFWATAIDRGYRGVVLDEVFLNYRVRPGSGYRRSLQPGTYRARLGHFYAKHRDAVQRHGVDLLLAKERFLLEQRAHRDALEARAASLEAERAALLQEIEALGAQLAARGRSRVDLGDLSRREPISDQWGRDRGTPVDRYFIERFLRRRRADIRGRVLEIEEARYARMFGGDAVERVDVLDRDPSNERATVVADLRHAEHLASGTYDCIILTQTIHLIDDMEAALRTCARLLAPGGVILATAPIVIRVDDRAGPDGDFWRLTEASARRLFASVFPLDAFEIETAGNVMACSAFLYGLAAEELAPSDLEVSDPRFPLVVAVRAMKPRAAIGERRPAAPGIQRSASGSAVVLAYHRVAALTPDTHHLCTPPDIFRAHMAVLRDGFTPMALDDVVEASAAGCLPERAVVVTLDDGYLDALTTASPILAAFGMPATFFVNSERLEVPHERDWDVLEHLLLGPTPVPKVLRIAASGTAFEAATGTDGERAAALEAVHRLLWPLDAEGRHEVVQAILTWGGCAPAVRDTHRVLTAAEVRELAGRPDHAIGSHTVHHLALTTQTPAVQRREVADDRAALERLLGRAATLCSYPYGDADANVAGAVRDAGFHAAVTAAPGVVRPGANRLFLPRVEPAPVDAGRYRDWLDERFRTR